MEQKKKLKQVVNGDNFFTLINECLLDKIFELQKRSQMKETSAAQFMSI